MSIGDIRGELKSLLAQRRLAGIVVLATLVAAAAMLFGALAVADVHPHEHPTKHTEAEPEHEAAVSPGELAGALLVSLAGVGIVPLALRSRRGRDESRERLVGREEDVSGALRLAVALTSAGAATIHFAVIAQHFEEYWLFGSFFVGVALLQLAWAMLVVFHPTRSLYLVGAAGNTVVAAMWLVSRTTGLPLGPGPGEPEAVGIADTAATVYEVVLAAGALLLLRVATSRRPLARFTVATALTTLAAVALTALSLVSLAGL
ncbi:MAG: hypothetical protein H0T09_03145 [Actinobacteria bacterium]|nr:hypothetical protein [Actinomycetota bacterium]